MSHIASFAPPASSAVHAVVHVARHSALSASGSHVSPLGKNGSALACPKLWTLIALVLTFVGLTSQPIWAHEQRIEHLIAKFDQSQDSDQVHVANEFFAVMHDIRLTRTQYYYDPRCQSDDMRARVWYWAARFYHNHRMDSMAVAYAQRAMPILELFGDSDLIAECDVYRALSLVRLQRFQEAEACAERATVSTEACSDAELKLLAQSAVAAVMNARGEYGKAMNSIAPIVDCQATSVSPQRRSLMYSIVSQVFMSVGQDEKALFYAERSFEAECVNGCECVMADRMAQMAHALVSLKRVRDAEVFLGNAASIFRRDGNSLALGTCCNLLADMQLERGDVNAAARIYAESLELFNRLGEMPQVCHAHLGLSRALLASQPDSADAHLAAYDSLMTQLTLLGKASAVHAELVPNVCNPKRWSTALYVSLGVIGLLLIVFGIIVLCNKRLFANLKRTVKELWLDLVKIFKGRGAIYDALTEKDHEFLARLSSAVQEQMNSGKWDVAELAKRMGLTASALRRKISHATGEKVNDYLRSLRIQRARKIIDNTTCRTAFDVACKCGYSNLEEFERDFEAVCLTPVQEYINFRVGSFSAQ